MREQLTRKDVEKIEQGDRTPQAGRTKGSH